MNIRSIKDVRVHHMSTESEIRLIHNVSRLEKLVDETRKEYWKLLHGNETLLKEGTRTEN